MEIGDLIAHELGLSGFEVENEVRIAAGAVVDLVIRQKQETYLVEVKGRPARSEDIAQVHFYKELWNKTKKEEQDAVGVLVSPGFTTQVRNLAHATGIGLIRLAPSHLPPEWGASGKVPLTSNRSWAVVVHLLKHEEAPGIRRLAHLTGVSPGWVSKVVQELRSRGIISHGASGIRLVDLTALLDAIAVERPLRSLETTRIATGLDEPGEVVLVLQASWNELQAAKPTAGLIVGGVTAAAEYTGFSIHHDRFDVYCTNHEPLARLFDGRRDGIQIIVHKPDKNMEQNATMAGGVHTVGPAQALLDVAGTGMTFRDLALRMVEVLRK